MTNPTDPTQAPTSIRAIGSDGVAPSKIVRELTGELPCVRCRYNLRGLTVKGMCPECGTSVRTTLLAVIDPKANELQPIKHPRLTAAALLVWSGSALAASLCNWAIRIADYVVKNEPLWGLRWLLLGLVAFSGIGGLVLIKPHAGIPERQIRWACGAILAYVALLLLMYQLHMRLDPFISQPYGTSEEAIFERGTLRIALSITLCCILLGLRPNARLLQARWLLMRIGAVGRQTLLVMVGVIAAWTLGDCLRLASVYFHGGIDDLIRLSGSMLILACSMFFTVCIAGVMFDCLRLKSIIEQPPLDLKVLTSVVSEQTNVGTNRSADP